MGRNIIRGASAREHAVTILRDGGTIDDAARITGFARNYVRQLGAREGIRFPRGHYKQAATRANKVVNLYSKGLTPGEIASRVGVKNVGTVYGILRKRGIHHIEATNYSYNEFRICKECGSIFFCSENSNKRFCCTTCRTRNGHRKNDSVRRARKRNALVDDDITLDKIVIRDGGICQLCGEKISWSDYTVVDGKRRSFGRYPSIDHKVALANGGLHSWDNVQLAHFSCNASKGVKLVV